MQPRPANLQGTLPPVLLVLMIHTIYQGIWTKSLQFYLDRANDPARNAKYSAYLGSQSSGVFHFGTDAAGDVGYAFISSHCIPTDSNTTQIGVVCPQRRWISIHAQDVYLGPRSAYRSRQVRAMLNRVHSRILYIITHNQRPV
jgi:hypothetical protein